MVSKSARGGLRSAETPRLPSPDSADGCIVIRNWMHEFGLSQGAKLVYALIYQYSEDGIGTYNGGLNYTAMRCGMTERTARTAVRELLDKGYIREVGHYVNGARTSGRSLQAVLGAAEAARAAWRLRVETTRKGMLKPKLYWDEGGQGEPTPAILSGVDGLTPEISSAVISSTPAILSGVDGLTPEISSAEISSTPAILSGVDMTGNEIDSNESAAHGTDLKKSDDSPRQFFPGSDIDRIGLDNIYINPNPNPIQSGTYHSACNVDRALAVLVDSAVNRRGLKSVGGRYSEIIAEGFSAAEIQAAWDARQADARKTVSGDSYMPNLGKWLSDEGATGARAMIVAARDRAEREKAPEAKPELTRLAITGADVYGWALGGRPMGPLLDERGKAIPIGMREAAERALLAACEGRVA